MPPPPLNPYAPPASVGSPNEAPTPARGEYRPLFALATAVTVALAVNIVIELASASSALTTLSAIKRFAAGGPDDDPALEGIHERTAMVGIGQGVALIAGAVAFCLLVARASRNAHSFGQMPMRFRTGWAVGFFFVPILSWWKPYQAFKEIWRASAPDTQDAHSLAHAQVPALLPAWWAAFLVHVAGSHASSRASSDLDSPQAFVTAAYVDIGAAIATIVAAALAITVVRALAARQDACQKAAEPWRAAQQAAAIR